MKLIRTSKFNCETFKKPSLSLSVNVLCCAEILNKCLEPYVEANTIYYTNIITLVQIYFSSLLTFCWSLPAVKFIYLGFFNENKSKKLFSKCFLFVCSDVSSRYQALFLLAKLLLIYNF